MKKKKAFTIVELVIVIGVIGILSAILIPTFTNLTTKAKQTALKANLSNAYHVYTSSEASLEKEYYAISDVYLVPEDNPTTGYKFENNEWSVDEHAITINQIKVSNTVYNGFYVYIDSNYSYLPARTDYDNYFKLDNELYLVEGLKFTITNAELINGNHYCLGGTDNKMLVAVETNGNEYIEWNDIKDYYKFKLHCDTEWNFIYYDTTNPSFVDYKLLLDTNNQFCLQPDNANSGWKLNYSTVTNSFTALNNSNYYITFNTYDSTKMGMFKGTTGDLCDIYFQPKSVLDYVMNNLFADKANFNTIKEFITANEVVLAMFQNETDYDTYRTTYETWAAELSVHPYL